MRRAITSFRGEAPRLTPRALPDNGAQEATNASLLTGDLLAFKQFATTIGLANPGVVETIYLLNDRWLSWSADVDVARGAIAGDTSFRVYLTSPDYYGEPRFTNYAMATSGAPPYPMQTRPLGVPAPSTPASLAVGAGTDPTIRVTDAGDQLTSWVTSGTFTAPNVVSEVSQDPAIGNPLPSYKLRGLNNNTIGAYAYKNFGVEGSTVITFESDFMMQANSNWAYAGWRIACSAAGAGAIVALAMPYGKAAGVYLLIGTSDTWGAVGNWLETIPVSGLSANATTWYRMVLTATRNETGTLSVNAKLYLSTSLLYQADLTTGFTLGGYCGVDMVVHQDSDPETVCWYDNFELTGSGSTDVISTTATSYVWTFVNDLGEESAPAPASSTVLRPDGVSVTVTTPTTIPSGVSSDYGITTKRIYRAATGNAGTIFRFVAEIPLATADYIDVLTDAQLGEALPSELWALPPADLEGILALPNGVMAGFVKNQLCLSAQNQPHAWPVEYRLTTDTDIVGIGNIDTTVVIWTKSFMYVAGGNDPAAYSMAKFEVPYAGSSKRSIDYLTGIGVVGAGPDGLMAVAGLGQIRNLTDSVFTREQWQALNPESMVSVAHNDIYWLFWEAGSARGCFGIDMKANGFGIVRMAFHASASFVDPIEDKMYLVLDMDDEPDDELLPVRADPPHYVDGRTIYEFEGNPSVLMTYRWLSKLWILENPSWFSVFQIEAQDYDNLLLRLYGDGAVVGEYVVTDKEEFTVDVVEEPYTRLQYELIGTSQAQIVQGAEDVSEIS